MKDETVGNQLFWYWQDRRRVVQKAEGYPMGSRLQYPPRLAYIAAVHACLEVAVQEMRQATPSVTGVCMHNIGC